MPSIPSLLPWRKSDKSEAPAEPAAAPATAIVAAPVAAETAPPSPVASAPSTPAKPTDAKPEVATFEIRRDESKPLEPQKEKRSDREGGVLNPIAKIAPPKKEIDLSSAETIIQDGEIVGDSSSGFQAAATSAPASSAPRQAPQVVNGVKTYSSWDDITARPSSVADRLINQIR